MDRTRDNLQRQQTVVLPVQSRGSLPNLPVSLITDV